MAGRDTYDKIATRTAYYEVIKTGGVTIIHDLPFYTVTYPGAATMMFEPIDCMARRQNGAEANNSSAYEFKDVHERRELDPRAKINYCQQSDTSLHSFGWSWPR